MSYELSAPAAAEFDDGANDREDLPAGALDENSAEFDDGANDREDLPAGAPAAAAPAAAENEQQKQPAEEDLPAKTPLRIFEISLCAATTKPKTVSALSVSVPANAKPNDRKAAATAVLASFLAGIREGKWRAQVEAYRHETDPARREKLKKTTIPQACFCGIYTRNRENKNLVSRSGLAVLDFDGKDNPEFTSAALRNHVAKYPFVIAAYVSPSGNGVKAIVRVPDNANEKKIGIMLRAAAVAIGAVADIGSGAMRHALVSYDPDAFIAPDIARVPVVPDYAVPQSFDRKTVRELMKDFPALADFYAAERGKYYQFSRRGGGFKCLNRTMLDDLLKTMCFPKSRAMELRSYLTRHRFLLTVDQAYSAHAAGAYPMNVDEVAISAPTADAGKTGFFRGVTGSPRLPVPRKGKWDNIDRVTRAIFGAGTQRDALFYWLKSCFERISARIEANTTGKPFAYPYNLPVALVCGDRGAGKTTFFNRIVVPLLGGRKINGAKALLSERFNSELKGAEIVGFDDTPENLVSRIGRNALADRERDLLFAEDIAVEGKFTNTETLKGACHCVYHLFNPEDALATPDFEKIRDKAFAFYARNFEILKDKRGNAEFESVITAAARELPAFAYYLTREFALPDALRADPNDATQLRIGARNFYHPETRELLEETDRARLALESYIEAAHDAGANYASKFFGRPISSTKFCEVARVKWSPPQAGVQLRKLWKKFPRIVERTADKGKGKCRGWIIRDPDLIDEPFSESPLPNGETTVSDVPASLLPPPQISDDEIEDYYE